MVTFAKNALLFIALPFAPFLQLTMITYTYTSPYDSTTIGDIKEDTELGKLKFTTGNRIPSAFNLLYTEQDI